MSEAQASGRPITNIERALGKRILIKLKGRRAIKAVLKSFDEHLNLFLEETVEITHHWDKEQNAVVKKENDLESIILRGDNVVFLTLDEAPEEVEVHPAPSVDNPDTSVDNPDTPVDNPDTPVDNPDTPVDNPDTPVDNPDTSVDNPDTSFDNQEM